jgi:hypothetical protein
VVDLAVAVKQMEVQEQQIQAVAEAHLVAQEVQESC